MNYNKLEAYSLKENAYKTTKISQKPVESPNNRLK
jgi:hypothetical protein